MGAHPNTILLLTLTPDGLSRKTMRDILAEAGLDPDESLDDQITIGGEEYHHDVMESDYDDGWQISAKEGDLLFFDLVTYGYGETVTWEKLEAQKKELEEWAIDVCKRHNCTHQIWITANHW